MELHFGGCIPSVDYPCLWLAFDGKSKKNLMCSDGLWRLGHPISVAFDRCTACSDYFSEFTFHFRSFSLIQSCSLGDFWRLTCLMFAGDSHFRIGYSAKKGEMRNRLWTFLIFSWLSFLRGEVHEQVVEVPDVQVQDLVAHAPFFGKDLCSFSTYKIPFGNKRVKTCPEILRQWLCHGDLPAMELITSCRGLFEHHLRYPATSATPRWLGDVGSGHVTVWLGAHSG